MNAINQNLVRDFAAMARMSSSWIEYTGPRKGRGWKNSVTSEIRYVEDMPGDDSPDSGESGVESNYMRDADWHYKNGTIPEGWFVHGRFGRKDLDTGRVTQLTRDWDVARQYAGKQGSMWMIRPRESARVIDLSNESTARQIAEKMLDAYRDGTLPGGLDEIVRIALEEYDSDTVIDQLVKSIAPESIVESAGFFDDEDFPYWLWDSLGFDFAITPDGAVVLDKTEIESEMVGGSLSVNPLLEETDSLPADSSPVDSWAEKHFKNPEHAKNFVKWFGDSKVVGENGEPLVVYHGTFGEFEEFNNPYADDLDGGWHMFSSSADYSEQFSDGRGGSIIPCFVKASNPLDLSSLPSRRGDVRVKLIELLGEYGFDIEKIKKALPYGKDLYEHINRKGARSVIVSEMKRLGFDSVIMPDAKSHVVNNAVEYIDATTWIVIDSSQIKSATGNQGTFDPDNKSIKMSAWVEYAGPRKGKGWKHQSTGEVRYIESQPQDDPVVSVVTESTVKPEDVAVESEDDQSLPSKQELTKNPNVFWHGTPSGDLSGGRTGLHVGTHEAAKQALEARIGIPADGEWDGTREYGKTLLAGQRRIRSMPGGKFLLTGVNMNAPEDDYYAQETTATYSDSSIVSLDSKPDIFPLEITGRMTNSSRSPRGDWQANGLMLRQIRKGNAKSGYFYKNVGEDAGSISAVVPSGSHIKRIRYKQDDDSLSINPLLALHGTAGDFDKFTTEKIGTGEGSHAYGWGLYFASARGVAEHYRNLLVSRTGGKGRIYTVDLKPEEEEMLDLDQHASDQSQHSEALKEIYSTIDSPYYRYNDSTGEQVYFEIEAAVGSARSNKFENDGVREELNSIFKGDSWKSMPNNRVASLWLASKGIRGLKFLDATSRSSGMGTLNYVIFSDDDVEIMSRMSSVTRMSSSEWTRYKGRRGGQGWQNQVTKEVRYQEDQPFDVSSDVDQTGLRADLLRAFHGSPHQFEKFTTEKIGTGEGEQVFGWGLYFTDKQDIAEHYRMVLGRNRWAIDGKVIDMPTWSDLEEMPDSDHTPEVYAAKAMQSVVGPILELALAADGKSKNHKEFRNRESARRAMEMIRDGRVVSPTGAIYEVDLAPEEDEYILWDRPLSEQSEKVKQALNVYKKNGAFGKITGEQLYQSLSDGTGHAYPRGQKSASEYLKSIGIRGIKYMDGSSRNSGDPVQQSYNYVIFDDTDVSIVNRMSAWI